MAQMMKMMMIKNLLVARPPEMVELLRASLLATRARYPEEGNLLTVTLGTLINSRKAGSPNFHVRAMTTRRSAGQESRILGFGTGVAGTRQFSTIGIDIVAEVVG